MFYITKIIRLLLELYKQHKASKTPVIITPEPPLEPPKPMIKKIDENFMPVVVPSSVKWADYQEFKKDELREMTLAIGRAVGLDNKKVVELLATIEKESGYNPNCVNDNGSSKDWGICQMNDYWYIGTNKPIASIEEALGNPNKCVRVMAEKFKKGHAKDWIAFRNGAYRESVSKYETFVLECDKRSNQI
jgi:hypothetical protein